MEVKIDKNSQNPVYKQIAGQLKEKIIRGIIPPGAVLPSERMLAKELGVHRNTVVKAYNSLKDQDLIEARPGKGYFAIEEPSFEQTSSSRPARHKANWQGLIKEKYHDLRLSFDDTYIKTLQATGVSFAAGAAEDVYGSEKIAEDLTSLLSLRKNKRALITPYQGDTELISALSKFVRKGGIMAEPSEIQVLYELNQAMDFLVAVLLDQGDCVLIEEPVSPDVYRAIELAGGKMVTVPVDEEGMIVEGIDSLIEKFNPKFIYVSTGYKDPTGTILSLERRRALMEISKEYALPIIEDNSGFDLNYEGDNLPSLKSMDIYGNVVYFYSFGLTFVPGMSLAFVIASKHLINALRYLVSMRIVTIDWIPQKLMAKYLEDGTYEAKTLELTEINRKKRDIMARYLDELSTLGFNFYKPEGGAYIWCKLPSGLNASTFAQTLVSRGLSVLPGQVFSADNKDIKDHLRLNFTFETLEKVEEGMKIFKEVAREAVGQKKEFVR